jgi:hypothetical protein
MRYSDKNIAQVIAPYKYYIIEIFKFGCGSLAVYTGTILLFYFILLCLLVMRYRNYSLSSCLNYIFLALECYHIPSYDPLHTNSFFGSEA